MKTTTTTIETPFYILAFLEAGDLLKNDFYVALRSGLNLSIFIRCSHLACTFQKTTSPFLAANNPPPPLHLPLRHNSSLDFLVGCNIVIYRQSVRVFKNMSIDMLDIVYK